MKKILISISLGALALTGCYEYKYTKSPYPIKHRTSTQYEIQSAYHWKLMAEDFANSLEKVKGNIYLVSTTNNDSVFAENFLNLLKSELIKRKKLVINDTDNATKIELKINVVRFNSSRSNNTHPFKLTALATGLWVAAGVKSPAVGAALLTGAVATSEVIDYDNLSKYYPNVPKHEIIINAYAYKDNQYLMALDKIYYIADKDVSLYEDSPIIEIRGGYE